jgi:hypothetical protein
MFPCLIIVARDQPALLAALTSIYAQDDTVEVRVDRRHPQVGNRKWEAEDRRSPPSLDTDLHEDGFMVFCRP